MCDSCIRLAQHMAGRLCDRCIRRLNAEHPGIELAVDNMHPLAHSSVLDTCVDRAIPGFLEGFNQSVASTFSSCQGVDMLPGRPGRWEQEPFIMIYGEHQPARHQPGLSATPTATGSQRCGCTTRTVPSTVCPWTSPTPPPPG